MAIAATAGNQASSSTNVSSLALPSFNQAASRHTVVTVVLGSVSSSVTSITDTKGNTYTLQIAVNGTGVRCELWACANSGAQTSDIITVNISPAATIAAAAEEYSGVSSFGNTGSASGSNYFGVSKATIQEGGNYSVSGVGFGCQSGDTLSVFEGTSRRTAIPAATAVGIGLADNTITAGCILPTSYKISASRNWAAVSLELRSGGAAVPYVTIGAFSLLVLTGRRGVMPQFVQDTGGGGSAIAAHPLGGFLA